MHRPGPHCTVHIRPLCSFLAYSIQMSRSPFALLVRLVVAEGWGACRWTACGSSVASRWCVRIEAYKAKSTALTAPRIPSRYGQGLRLCIPSRNSEPSECSVARGSTSGASRGHFYEVFSSSPRLTRFRCGLGLHPSFAFALAHRVAERLFQSRGPRRLPTSLV